MTRSSLVQHRDRVLHAAQRRARIMRHLGRHALMGTGVGIVTGTAAAVFLYGLALVTEVRHNAGWLLWLLPVAGLVVGLCYHYVGGRAAEGNNLVLDAIADTQSHRVPKRMGALVLAGTWITHLFGGSAGREGTAIQMGGAIADSSARLVRLQPSERRLMLIAGVAAGFGSVFSVPLAGAVFALEVQTPGRLRHDALLPALTASVVGNATADAWSLPHDVTPTVTLPDAGLDVALLAKVVVAAAIFGLVSAAFSMLTDVIKRGFGRWVHWSPARPLIGGMAVVLLVLAIGSTDYLGLSLPLIDEALSGADIVAWAFALKLLLTAVTLGAGFQGGEVTPLFVIGATLGAALSAPLDVSQPLLAALGFVAVFAAATNTPLACTIMGVELFGIGAVPYLAVACVVAYLCSPQRGIYRAQHPDVPKSPHHRVRR